MDELIAFLRSRLDEDEAVARAADTGPWEVGPNAARKGMVYIREEGDLVDSVGLTWREPVFTAQVPNKTRFRENATHIARHDPARVLREAAAKRAIVLRCENVLTAFHDRERGMWPDVNRRERSHADATLCTLAAVYSDHPDYRQEWKP